MSDSCPRCSRTDTRLVSSTPQYRFLEWERLSPYAVVQVFACPCGTTFTSDVRVQPRAEDFCESQEACEGGSAWKRR